MLPCLTLLGGCTGIQSDLRVQRAAFQPGSNKSSFVGAVKNLGQTTYRAVYVEIDLYSGEDKIKSISTAVKVDDKTPLKPGDTMPFIEEYEDGGHWPTGFIVTKLWGLAQ